MWNKWAGLHVFFFSASVNNISRPTYRNNVYVYIAASFRTGKIHCTLMCYDNLCALGSVRDCSNSSADTLALLLCSAKQSMNDVCHWLSPYPEWSLMCLALDKKLFIDGFVQDFGNSSASAMENHSCVPRYWNGMDLYWIHSNWELYRYAILPV